MAELTGKAISELPAATTIGNSDLIALSQNGESKKITPSVLLSGVESEISGLNSLLSTYVRPNLLDNWYFVGGGSQRTDSPGCLPINQRGQTVYNGYEYTIDRWTTNNSGVTETIGTDGITLAWTAAGVSWGQIIGMPVAHSLKGKTVTLSVLCKELSGNVYLTDSFGFAATHFDQSISVGVTQKTFVVSDNPTSSVINIWGNANASAKIQAIKLELGDTQTLAHWENDQLVLNEVPDYDDQMMRCCSSVADTGDPYGNKPYNAIKEQLQTVNGQIQTINGKLQNLPSKFIWQTRVGSFDATGVTYIPFSDFGITARPDVVLLVPQSGTLLMSYDWDGSLQSIKLAALNADGTPFNSILRFGIAIPV